MGTRVPDALLCFIGHDVRECSSRAKICVGVTPNLLRNLRQSQLKASSSVATTFAEPAAR
jgi:hypothetical protein